MQKGGVKNPGWKSNAKRGKEKQGLRGNHDGTRVEWHEGPGRGSGWTKDTRAKKKMGVCAVNR